MTGVTGAGDHYHPLPGRSFNPGFRTLFVVQVTFNSGFLLLRVCEFNIIPVADTYHLTCQAGGLIFDQGF